MTHARPEPGERACGLCGARTNLTKTPCCDRWICDDGDEYVLFSFTRSSCWRNHTRYTLCGPHFFEAHDGDWKTCEACRQLYDKTERYVWAGTNDYNFEKLKDPPPFEPTRCATCDKVIQLGEEPCSILKGAYRCGGCGPSFGRPG